MSNTFLYDVRCACCRARIGVSATQKWGLYCDEFCAQDIPAVEHEARDAVIEALIRDSDMPLATIGKKFDLVRQRMYQIAASRDLRKAVQ
jgi:hypothetical protein